MIKKELSGYPSIDKPWLKYYDTALTEEDIPECSAFQMLYENNKEWLLFEWIENYTQITFIDTFPILAALGLFALLCYKCSDALGSMRDRENYIRSLEDWKKKRNKQEKQREKLL